MKEKSRWYSHRVQQDVSVVRYGHYGTPVLMFPTAGGDAEESERFLMMDALGSLLEEGKIKVYSVDSVAGRAWTYRTGSPQHCSWLQNQYDAFIYHEVVPAIRKDCLSDDIELITCGASIGAFNALASLCRHPDVFRLALCMSGTYDLSKWLEGDFNLDFYFSSPLHFLPNLKGSLQLDQLRQRLVILATGEGQWEDPGESWRAAHVLGAQGVPNRVDLWGQEWDHDWVTWRAMAPHYLGEHA